MLKGMFSLETVILRHFFEAQGFLVRQCLPATPNGIESLHVINPVLKKQGEISPILFVSDIGNLQKGLLWLPGWNALKIIPSQVKTSRELMQFIDKRLAERKVPAEFDETDAAKIVVVPSIPTEEPYRSETLDLLRVRKIDAMLSLKAVLMDLIARLDMRQPREGLQLLQLLANFDLLKTAQMELFQDDRKR
jgi:hypothetical protein